MPETRIAEMGGYRYLPGVFQYSCGVAALPGFAIHRVIFDRLPRLPQGFAMIAKHLASVQRPLQAFCHCELRSPAPFSDESFRSFNLQYTEVLRSWGVFLGDDNPVARSNLCPRITPPAEPSFYAFSYTVESSSDSLPSFVISGCGEAPEGKPNYRDFIVRRGDSSDAALLEKARFVLAEQSRRLIELGFRWSDVLSTNVYTIRHLPATVAQSIRERGANPHGFTWHDCLPPVVDIEFEMDCRRVTRELLMGE